MSSPTAYAFDRQRIVVADEDSAMATMIVATLRRDGHCVTHDPGALSAPYPIALTRCHLLISSLQVAGIVRMDLLGDLRERLPALPILYLTNAGQSMATAEAQLPEDLPRLRAPFGTAELRAAVGRLLPQLRAGTVLALPVREPGAMADTPVPSPAKPVAMGANGA